jgi:hypothetical protein
MKNRILSALTLTALIIPKIFFSQEVVKYDDVQNALADKGQYTSYIAKDGSTYNVGDKIKFGTPSGVNGKFVTIQKVDIAGTIYVVGAEAINTSAEIKKIRVTGTKRAGYKVQLQTKGMTGIDNYFVYIEDAILIGEIKSFGMTSDEALSELKKAKDKLDLGIISQEEYDLKKAELTPFIK